MMPNDFKMASVYGVGRDWPFAYDDIERYYYQSEVMMGDVGTGRRIPVSPAPAICAIILPIAWLGRIECSRLRTLTSTFQQPTARARVATANRSACCATGICNLCPVDAKFTILNEMGTLYKDERITLDPGSGGSNHRNNCRQSRRS